MWNIVDTWESYDADKDGEGNLEISDKIYKRFIEKNYQIIEKVEQIGMPQKGEQLRLITMKPFNTISIISHIAKSEIIEDAIFVIFAINQSAAKILIDLHEKGRLKEATMIVSQIRNAGHESKSKAIDMLKAYFPITYVNSHGKTSILKTDKENYYNIEGSGNFSFNGRLEQYVIDNEKGMYDFSKKWVKEIMKYLQK